MRAATEEEPRKILHSNIFNYNNMNLYIYLPKIEWATPSSTINDGIHNVVFDFLCDYGFSQFVSEPTRLSNNVDSVGNILDVILSTDLLSVNVDDMLQPLGSGVTRRGDYLHAGVTYWGFTTAPAEYYEHAMTYFRRLFNNVHFVVCSDDIKWARDHLRGDDVIFSENNSHYVDMDMCAVVV